MENNLPLVSIIIATYNSATILERCLLSIINQNYRNYELIIIDGASADTTVDIIKKYTNYITYWKSEKDNGIYEAWNKGLVNAKGEWVAFVGSDDMFYPDAIKNYMKFINLSDIQYDYISSKVERVDNDGKVVRVFGWPWEWEKSKKACTVAHPGSLHNKRLFKKYGLFDTKFKICGDYEFLLRCGKAMKAGFMDLITLKMSLGGLSDSKSVVKETYYALRLSNSVSPATAIWLFIMHNLKFHLRRSLHLLKSR